MLKQSIRTMKRALGDPDFLPNLSYGQNGEDLVLDRMLDRKNLGFYVDVGAHHPVRFSNTYLFYRRGWHGVNIDAQPGSMHLFRKHRPRDINIECGVGTHDESLAYFRFDEPALNTFSEEEAKLKNAPPYRLLDSIIVRMRPLRDILAEVVPAGQAIDFMSIDVEGLDLDVLESNDWGRFRPAIILTEALRTNILELEQLPAVRLLAEFGYRAVAKAYDSLYFQRQDGEP